MALNIDEQFYSDLTLQKIPLSNLVAGQALFEEIPRSWHVIITDIVGSTPAVFGGRHEEVNLIATGSIVTVLNIAFSMNVTVPFFFGGDGATFIVPSSVAAKVMDALLVYRENTLNNFNLELRTGIVAVEKIYQARQSIKIAKLKRSKTFSIPIVLGNGLAYAEALIKGDDFIFSDEKMQETQPDLSGMQCRWDKIAPPRDKEEIVTLLVIAINGSDQGPAFEKILRKMDSLYGAPEKRQPISIAKLKLKSTFNKLGTEMRARIGKIRLLELLKTWIVTLYGYVYFQTKKGRNYLKSLVEMSDTLVIDGKINTVMSGTVAQRKELEKLLDRMEADGEILYGIHVSGASIMSCYVRDIEDGHIHFVDGSEGGYTNAAKMLKAKFLS
jgi:hypothetical protein